MKKRKRKRTEECRWMNEINEEGKRVKEKKRKTEMKGNKISVERKYEIK